MLLTVKALSLEMAKQIADAAERKAIENHIKIVIAIMDDHGNLKYYRRMDGNNYISIPLQNALFCILKCSLRDEDS